MNTRGELLISTQAANDRVAIFDRFGVFTDIVGRSGEGPGEFERISGIFVQHDTVNIIDSGVVRWTRLDRDFQVVGTTQLPARPINAVFWDGRLVANMEIGSAERRGYPLHEVTITGAVTRSFGYEAVDHDAETPYANHRLITTCPDGSLWYAPVMRYDLTRVASDRTQRRYRRNAVWFQPHSGRPGFTLEVGPPPPMLAQIWCDSRNRIWTLTHVADGGWRSAGLRDPQRDYHVSRWELEFRPHDYWDTVIEVIDPARGRVVARGRSDMHIVYLLADGVLSTYHERDGEPTLSVWRSELVDSQPQENRDM